MMLKKRTVPKTESGAFVIISNPLHPHYRETGTLIAEEFMSLIGKTMWKVQGNWNEFFASVGDFRVTD